MTEMWRSYLGLCKPKVVLLMLLSAWVGMVLASQTEHQTLVLYPTVTMALAGIGLLAAAGAALNHILDQHFDAVMNRTQRRPLPQRQLEAKHAWGFAILLSVLGWGLLWTYTNPWATMLTLIAMLGYAVIYTRFLKHATPQNIVIGGLSGAMPPLLGWVSITGHVSPEALLLVALIFAWTPAHFWCLAIYRLQDYERAGIPMLPVTHGIPFTQLQIVLYGILTVAVSMLLMLIDGVGFLYLVGATCLNMRWIQWLFRVYRHDQPRIAFQAFRFSNLYLMGLWLCLLLDPVADHGWNWWFRLIS